MNSLYSIYFLYLVFWTWISFVFHSSKSSKRFFSKRNFMWHILWDLKCLPIYLLHPHIVNNSLVRYEIPFQSSLLWNFEDITPLFKIWCQFDSLSFITDLHFLWHLLEFFLVSQRSEISLWCLYVIMLFGTLCTF